MADNRNEHILQSQLEEYCKDGPYPMHMPGHKRQISPAPGLPYAWDLTEVDGVDDLHHAEGILKDAMTRTSKLWGSRRSWYLVNGSTCGILAAIYAAVSRGGEVIVARNCHKSVYHAAELLNLNVHWLLPEYVTGWDIFGSVRPESVRKMIRRYPGSRAVMITSPTYEGIVSDIRSIAAICHEAGIPLLVDEAHGAHFGLFPESGFPDSAIHLGADLVIQSAHKTLPSLTQTALLHLGRSSLVAEKAVDHALDLFETSSPSYPLMASLDGCTGILRERGRSLFADWRQGIRETEDVIAGLRYLEVFAHGETVDRQRNAETDSADGSRTQNRQWQPEAVWRYDSSRFLLRARDRQNITGQKLAELLRMRCGIESEMHCGRNVLLMTGCGDSKEGYMRLGRALRELDAILTEESGFAADGSAAPQNGEITGLNGEKQPWNHKAVFEPKTSEKWAAEQVCPIADAVEQERERRTAGRALSDAAGDISAEYVMAYPPGIPILIPGERITEDAIRAILYLNRQGSNVIWSVSEQGDRSDEPVIEVLQ